MDRAVQRQWRRRLVRGRWQRRRRSKGRRRLLRSRRLRLLPLLSKGMKSAEGALLTATATHPPPPPSHRRTGHSGWATLCRRHAWHSFSQSPSLLGVFRGEGPLHESLCCRPAWVSEDSRICTWRKRKHTDMHSPSFLEAAFYDGGHTKPGDCPFPVGVLHSRRSSSQSLGRLIQDNAPRDCGTACRRGRSRRGACSPIQFP